MSLPTRCLRQYWFFVDLVFGTFWRGAPPTQISESDMFEAFPSPRLFLSWGKARISHRSWVLSRCWVAYNFLMEFFFFGGGDKCYSMILLTGFSCDSTSHDLHEATRQQSTFWTSNGWLKLQKSTNQQMDDFTPMLPCWRLVPGCSWVDGPIWR